MNHFEHDNGILRILSPIVKYSSEIPSLIDELLHIKKDTSYGATYYTVIEITHIQKDQMFEFTTSNNDTVSVDIFPSSDFSGDYFMIFYLDDNIVDEFNFRYVNVFRFMFQFFKRIGY